MWKRTLNILNLIQEKENKGRWGWGKGDERFKDFITRISPLRYHTDVWPPLIFELIAFPKSYIGGRHINPK